MGVPSKWHCQPCRPFRRGGSLGTRKRTYGVHAASLAPSVLRSKVVFGVSQGNRSVGSAGAVVAPDGGAYAIGEGFPGPYEYGTGHGSTYGKIIN
eukprot:scaffold26052_cov108-Cylindrotheca_fusiformis.AAC.3